MIQGEPAHIVVALRNRKGELIEPEGALTLRVTKPDGTEDTYKYPAEIEKEGKGNFFKDVATTLVGLWHFRWLDSGQSVAEGSFPVESEFADGLTPDLTDLKVLVPRARRKIEGPWGNPNGKPPLTNGEIYALVADACSEIIMLGGSWFHHTLKVKKRDPLGGFPTDWQTDTALEEYEAAIICAQLALDYYFHIFSSMRVSETIKNEGTEWAYSLSANVIRSYVQSLIDERDKAIAGLRINIPVMDRYASNIRVRDQATVAVLEWWAGQYDALPGGLPGGQEASVVPVFFPPGLEGGSY